jgi:hypothetical protein
VVRVRFVNRCVCLALIASLAGLAGCRGSIAGDWHMVRCTPNRETFSIDDVSFARDGGYTAKTILEGRSADETGTFDFNGYKLTLRPAAGGQRSYNAVLRLRELDISDRGRQVLLRKGKK